MADVFRHVYSTEKKQVAARLAAALVDCGHVTVLTEAMIHLGGQVSAAEAEQTCEMLTHSSQAVLSPMGSADCIQGDAHLVATLELGLIKLGRLSALGQANNSLMASMHLKEAAKIAGERPLFSGVNRLLQVRP